MHTIERRFTTQATLRVDPGGGIGSTIEGYAARFNVCSHDLGGFVERIKQGAFTRSLQSDRDVVCLVNHNNDRILGRRKNRTLSLNQDDRGLHFRCLLPDTTDGRDVAALLARGDLSECSFAFTVDDDGDEWTEEDRSRLFLDDDDDEDEDDDDEDDDDDDDKDEDRSQYRSQRVKVRTLKSVTLLDCSIVVSPAYPRTSVGLSSTSSSLLGRSYTASDYFPEGVPQEVRRHISQAVNPRAQESRRRLFNFLIG
jgi:HK97 family phage prohead protease